MSLYYTQKFIYLLNRDTGMQQRFKGEPERVLAEFDLTDEERAAIRHGDIGLLYVLGVNGQILMHYAAFLGMPWPDYLAAMREGVKRYGPVRRGLYAMSTEDNK